MAHEITELQVTILRNPPWYRRLEQRNSSLAGGLLLVRPSPWGNGSVSRPRVWKLNVELVTPTFLLGGGWSQDDDFIDTA